MSLEFGVLRDGSTITLIGELRIPVEEDVFDELAPLWRQVECLTGESLDKYESAKFEGASLMSLIEALREFIQGTEPPDNNTKGFICELLRIASEAYSTGKPISYFGL